MATQRKQRHTPELKVLFDTSALHTAVASDLVRNEVAQLIRENSSHPDLKVTWYMPYVVVHERQYQMVEKGKELLPSINKVERLLDHNLNITDQVIERSVRDCVEKQLKELNILQFGLDTTKVDWPRLINDALYRNPPFERGDKEKGFRDAMIMEEVLQIIAASPTTPRICRIAFVAGDDILAIAVRGRTSDNKNVHVIKSLDELEGLINTLVAKVTEALVAELQEQAGHYFYTQGEEGFWTKEKLGKKIWEKFRKELKDLPKGAEMRENGDTWYISPPRFARKEAQRVFWASGVRLECSAYRYTTEPSPAMTLRPSPSILDLNWRDSIVNPPLQVPQTPHLNWRDSIVNPPWQVPQTPRMRRVLVTSGSSLFDIIWSVSISRRYKFSLPKLEDITFRETSWE